MIVAAIDTNVIFEGLTKQGGSSGIVIDAWYAGLFRPVISNPLVFEYIDVLSRLLSDRRWRRIQPLLNNLLAQARYIDVHYSWRPISPDPADDHIIDLAMNARAIIVTHNFRDFRSAQLVLGLPVMAPATFIALLSDKTI